MTALPSVVRSANVPRTLRWDVVSHDRPAIGWRAASSVDSRGRHGGDGFDGQDAGSAKLIACRRIARPERAFLAPGGRGRFGGPSARHLARHAAYRAVL